MDPFDQLFAARRFGRFDPSIDPALTPQEGAIGHGQISPYGFLEPGSVDNAQLVDGAITHTKITDGEITTPKLAANSVTAAAIAAGAITASAIAVGSVDSTKMTGAAANDCPNPGWEIVGGATLDTDGGFVGVPGWSAVNNSSNLQITSSPARTGAHGTRFKTATGNQPAVETGNIPVMPGHRYRISAWFRGVAGNSGSATATFYVRYRDANGNSLGFVTCDSGSSSPSTIRGANTTWTQLADYALMPATAVYASIGVSTLTGAGGGDFLYADDVEFYRADEDIKHASGNVLIDASGVTITNGALTLTNAGATVIIDGTSDIFKIFATGTASRTFPAAPGTSITTVTITGSGGTMLMSLFQVTDNNGAAPRSLGIYLTVANAGTVQYFVWGYSDLSGGANRVNLVASSRTLAGVNTAGMRYYVLVEAGL